MPHYVAYYRVSTSKQGQSGLGLEAQERAVSAFANGSVIKAFTEIESGRKDDRPVLAEALAYAKDTGATLLIAKVDRLARDVHFVSGLLKSGVPIVCADMPEANIMVLQMMAVMAEQEARMISLRTKDALKSAKDRGVKLGSDNAAIRNAIVAKGDASAERVFEWIRDIPDYESLTLQAIADSLNKNGYTTPRGKAFNPMQVSRVLNRIK